MLLAHAVFDSPNLDHV